MDMVVSITLFITLFFRRLVAPLIRVAILKPKDCRVGIRSIMLGIRGFNYLPFILEYFHRFVFISFSTMI